MKDFSDDLIALLASRIRMFKADLFKIGPLLNGKFIYATNGGEHVDYNGQRYHPLKYGSWSRDSMMNNVGLESNSSKLTVFCDNRIFVDFPGFSDVFMMDGIKYGLLGAAPVTIYTAYMPTWGQVIGSTGGSLVETKFVGVVTKVENLGMTKAEIIIQDMLYLLNIQVPRMIFQASCSNVLYDAKCTLHASQFQRSGIVGWLINGYTFQPLNPLTTISAAGTFAQGRLTWTSGKNNGLSAMVMGFIAGPTQQFILDVTPIFPIAVDDHFNVFEGCSKQFSSCLNLQPTLDGGSPPLAMAYHNFAGQPFTPVPETAI